MQDEVFGSPTAAELTEAVREFVASLAADIPPERAFHLRVAVNALRVVERELADAGQAEAAHERRLAALGASDDGDLALSIRAGRVPPERRGQVLASVLADVEARLRASSPDYAARYEADE
jgi:Domain of unknown function (DUF6285)